MIGVVNCDRFAVFAGNHILQSEWWTESKTCVQLPDRSEEDSRTEISRFQVV